MPEENIKTNELPLEENLHAPQAMPLSVVPPMVTIDVDSSLQEISEIPENESKQSIHNLNSAYLGENREEDEYLKINKIEKINFSELARLEQEYKPNIDFEVSHFQDKRPISKQLSDQNDEKLLSTINREVRRALDSEQLLAEAIDLEDKEREIADAQLLADIKKEAATRANVDAQLANTLAQYKYDMSQHVTTRELDVNGDARVNIEVVDGDKHGGSLQVETTLVVGSNTEENGSTTAEGNVIGDAHIKHDLFVDNDTTLEKVVHIRDDNNTKREFSDIIGSIRNALVKDFTQSYDPTTGKLTSTLEFQNYHDSDDRPQVETITKTIDLDLEKFIIDINDVYAKKTITNGEVSYKDYTPTETELVEISKSEYSGNIVKCLKVSYSTFGNNTASEEGSAGDKAGTEISYVYFEVNDIFKSIIAKHEKDIADLKNYLSINTRTIALYDADGLELMSFKAFAPDAGAAKQSFNLDQPITLKTITVQ